MAFPQRKPKSKRELQSIIKKNPEGYNLMESIKALHSQDDLDKFLSKGIRLQDINIICLLGAGAFAKVFLVSKKNRPTNKKAKHPTSPEAN